MGAQGHHEKSCHLWPHHRPTRGERVGGGSRRCCAHDTVAPPPGQRSTIDFDQDIDHALPSALLQAHLVHRPRSPDTGAIAKNRHVQSRALLDGPSAFDQRLNDERDILGFSLGEKTDMAEIDPQQRCSGFRELCGPQDGSVAAEDHDHIGPRPTPGGIGRQIRRK